MAIGVATRQRSDAARAVLLRGAAMSFVVVAVGAVHLSHRPATVCPLRAMTGIPCPFCGGTTAAVHLGHADIRGALAASPFAVALLVGLPFVGVVRPPRWWASRAVRWSLVVAVLVFAEVWQLLRLGVIGV